MLWNMHSAHVADQRAAAFCRSAALALLGKFAFRQYINPKFKTLSIFINFTFLKTL